MMVYNQSSAFQLSKYPCSHFWLQSECLTTGSHLWLLAAPHNKMIGICHFSCWLPQKAKTDLLYPPASPPKSLYASVPLAHLHTAYLNFTVLLCHYCTLLSSPTQQQSPTPCCTCIAPSTFAPLHVSSTNQSYLSCLLACLQATWDIQIPVSFPMSLVVIGEGGVVHVSRSSCNKQLVSDRKWCSEVSLMRVSEMFYWVYLVFSSTAHRLNTIVFRKG